MPGLGRAVVGLADVPEDARRARRVDHAAAHLLAGLRALAPVRARVAERREVALEVHRDDGVPLLLGHVHEHPVAEDPGVVDEDVEAAVAVDRAAAPSARPRRSRRRRRSSRPPGRRRRRSRSRPPGRGTRPAPSPASEPPRSLTTTLRSRAREGERVLAADAAAGAGHDRNLALERRHCGMIVRPNGLRGRTDPDLDLRRGRVARGRSRPTSGRRARPRRSSRGRSTTSRAAPAPSRRCARTARHSSGAGCGRGCCGATASGTSRSRCSARVARAVPARAGRRPLDRARRGRARGGARVRGHRRAADPLERGLALDRGGGRGDGRRARWFQLYWVNDREIAASFVAARGGGRVRRDRRHARHADARLA